MCINDYVVSSSIDVFVTHKPHDLLEGMEIAFVDLAVLFYSHAHSNNYLCNSDSKSLLAIPGIGLLCQFV